MNRSLLVGAVVALGLGVIGFAIVQLLPESDPPAGANDPSRDAARGEAAANARTTTDAEAGPPVSPRKSVTSAANAGRTDPVKPPAPKPSALDRFPPVPVSLEAMDQTFRADLLELMALADGDHAQWYAQFKKTEESLTAMSLAAGDDEKAQAALRARNQTFMESVASHGAQ